MLDLAGDVVDVQNAETIFVADEGELLAVVRHIEALNIPGNRSREVIGLARRKVETRKPVELRLFVRRGVDRLVVGTELPARVGNLLRAAFGREQLLFPARRVDDPKVALVGRDLFQHGNATAIMRPVEYFPSATLELG